MNEQGDATMSGSRRKFLRTAGVAASGAALIGANQRLRGTGTRLRNGSRGETRRRVSFAPRHNHRTPNKPRPAAHSRGASDKPATRAHWRRFAAPRSCVSTCRNASETPGASSQPGRHLGRQWIQFDFTPGFCR